jgi:hypothetical protein
MNVCFGKKIHPKDGGRERIIMQKQGYVHSKEAIYG